MNHDDSHTVVEGKERHNLANPSEVAAMRSAMELALLHGCRADLRIAEISGVCG